LRCYTCFGFSLTFSSFFLPAPIHSFPKPKLLMPDVQSPEAPSPIINSPFLLPARHWRRSADNGLVEVLENRRPAGYDFKTEAQMRLGFAVEENYHELALVNRLRWDVGRWRDSGYRGATSVTKELFDWWFKGERERPFFFCQREALETVVYLAEMRFPARSAATGFSNFHLSDADLIALMNGHAPSFHERDNPIVPTLVDASPNPDYPQELIRVGCKMATGSGKTVVMALLLAWAFCNHARSPLSTIFPGAALIVAPNLTVKERLEVLRPDIEGNYFQMFDIVPSKWLPALQSGKVLVTNWHRFAPQEASVEGGKSYKVVDKGQESSRDFARRVLGDLYDAMPLLVMNDEGHHCWRPAPNDPQKHREEILATTEGRDKETEEARMWLEGLDKINNGAGIGTGTEMGKSGASLCGVSLCVDLSATPFYLAGSGHPEGRPFPWLISDFGLRDAIECGIVKTPRIPVKSSSGRSEPEFRNLWAYIHKNTSKGDFLSGGKKLKPEVIYKRAQPALVQLAGGWLERLRLHLEHGEGAVPAVMIVVCDNTDVAKVFYEMISGEREEVGPVVTIEEVEAELGENQSEDGGAGEGEGAAKAPKKAKPSKRVRYGPSDVLPELANTPEHKRTIRIDSKLLAEAESDDPHVKRDAHAEALRRIVATVGRRGEPGEQVRCVVSVSMLTEGWDANNVTHILGVRAFGSQLLCEQVVGRALRRLSYELDPDTGLLREEVADIYGIPFSLTAAKGQPQDAPPPEPVVYTAVKALPAREAFELRFPNVEGYAPFSVGVRNLRCDIAAMPAMHIEPTAIPTATFVAATTLENGGQGFGWELQNRAQYYATRHLQTIKFHLAAMLLDDLVKSRGESDRTARVLSLQARHQLFPQVFGFVDAYIGSPEKPSKVRFNGQNPGEIGLQTYSERLIGRLRDAITPDEEAGETPLLPLLNRFKPIGSTRDVHFVTSRIVQGTTKSHLSGLVCDTQRWEQAAAFALEASGSVRCYARNDRLGLRIPYEYEGLEHFYEPDFLVEMLDEKLTKVLLEIKGYSSDRDDAKHGAANRWLEAVNNWGQLGTWKPQIVVCKEPQLLKETLAQL